VSVWRVRNLEALAEEDALRTYQTNVISSCHVLAGDSRAHAFLVFASGRRCFVLSVVDLASGRTLSE